MKARLMHADRDWAEEPVLTARFRTFKRERLSQGPAYTRAVIQDLALDTLFGAMAAGDEFIFEASHRALLSGVDIDVDTVLYRQAILKDCLAHQAAVREMYGLVVGTIGGERKYYVSDHLRHPSSVLFSAIEALNWYMSSLRKLRTFAATQSGNFKSLGFAALFAMLQHEFTDEYFASVQKHLDDLKFREGALISAALGQGNESVHHTLRQPPEDDRNWLQRLVSKRSSGYTFYVHERDEVGARVVGELRDRGINRVANALAQSTDHVLSFFEMLRAELAFYVGALNLHERLVALSEPICFPEPSAVGTVVLHGSGLYDVCLALQAGCRVVGNSLAADGKRLIVVTGANQGGKSTFLRSVGLAQLMMQCGLFVGAESFAADMCSGIFTHYKREEDATMKSGKFDEELTRLSGIADVVKPNALTLFNESFASTNEREGSEVARGVVDALLERRIKVLFVTHLFDFARSVFDRGMISAQFLRAERLADGDRTFKVVEGEPLQTSFGQDLYAQIFVAQESHQDGLR